MSGGARKFVARYLAFCGLLAHVALICGLIWIWHAGVDGVSGGLKDYLRTVHKSAKKAAQHMGVIDDGLAAVVEVAKATDAFAYRALPPHGRSDLAYGRVLEVGSDKPYVVPSSAARVAQDGDIVLIDPGDYPGDVAVWTANDLTISGRDGVARLDAGGFALAEKKAIWVIRGNNYLIENIEFTGARSRDRNGAGIRQEGKRLHVRGCYFHDNEEGILSGRIPGGRITVEHSEFARNGHSDGQAHQIYVGKSAEFTFRFNYVHSTRVGSAIKSRAALTRVLYNRVVDGRDGSSNYTVDLSSGGLAFIIGNQFQQGANTQNYTIVTYAPEGQAYQTRGAYIVHNTLVSDRNTGNFIKNHGKLPLRVYNNLLVGNGSIVTGAAVLVGNVVTENATARKLEAETLNGSLGSARNLVRNTTAVADRAAMDYRPRDGASVIDFGVAVEAADGEELEPDSEYKHPLRGRAREVVGRALDAGALERPR